MPVCARPVGSFPSSRPTLVDAEEEGEVPRLCCLMFLRTPHVRWYTLNLDSDWRQRRYHLTWHAIGSLHSVLTILLCLSLPHPTLPLPYLALPEVQTLYSQKTTTLAQFNENTLVKGELDMLSDTQSAAEPAKVSGMHLRWLLVFRILSQCRRWP